MIYKGRIRQRKPVFEVTLEGEAASLGGEYEVMLDTGFSGFLYVPKQIASDLGGISLVNYDPAKRINESGYCC